MTGWPMDEISMPTVWFCRLVVVLVFAASALSKLRGSGAFAGFLEGVHALSGLTGRRAAAAAGVVIAAELAVVVLLLAPATGRWGFALAAVLLGVFTWRLAVTGTVACRCFGGSAASSRGVGLVRNLVLVVICSAGWVAAVPAGAPASVPALVLSAAGAALLAGMLVFMPSLVDLFSLRG